MTPITRNWFEMALIQARAATCERARCGAVVEWDGKLIGAGFNSPPNALPEQRRCSCMGPSLRKPKSDRTCCVHAEWRALHTALMNHARPLWRTTLYFVRVDAAGNVQPSGHPYCTVCSRMALDLGVDRWVLWHEDGIRQYSAALYNDLSHAYDHALLGPPTSVPIMEAL